MLPLVYFIPLALAWSDWFGVTEQRPFRKALSMTGLLLLSTVPLISIAAMVQVSKSHGITPTVIHLEGFMFGGSLLSIPFLCFGYRMARWVGVASAIVLPLVAAFVNTLY